jgi:methylenetetrahydrofolate reductase (NADPH)
MYTPDDLVDLLDAAATNPETNISGLHIYTFNDAEATKSWRRKPIGNGE